ncbi:MAG: TIGR04086 family membrane protein [Phycisphaerales bacterium]|nr:TIGR04086 family membrane protein [Phycisphaerales bacterium]MCI0631099.1 TIGR04086 family membrane protein [Phycisphaerales bacterium]MCI0675443.1 TIGR04086 family membrane protein [Phycisphaerales bacterium]
MIDETRFKETPATATEWSRRPAAAEVPREVPRVESVASIDYRPVIVKRASWGAIIAGLVCAMAIQTLLYLLGAAIGLSVISPARANTNTLQGLGVGAGIWMILSAIIGLFVGGWVAGRLAGIPRGLDATLHGVAVWATGLVLSALLAVAFSGAALGGALTSLGLGSGSGNPQSQQPSTGFTPDRADQPTGSQRADRSDAQHQADIMKDVVRENEQARDFVRQRLGSLDAGADVDPNDLRDDDSLINDLAAAVIPGADRDAHQQAVEALADNADMSQSEAQRSIDQWQSDFRAQASKTGTTSARDREKARQTAEEVRGGAATGAWWAFFAMLLGLGAAGFGGYLGTPREALDVSRSDYAIDRRGYRGRTYD